MQAFSGNDEISDICKTKKQQLGEKLPFNKFTTQGNSTYYLKIIILLEEIKK